MEPCLYIFDVKFFWGVLYGASKDKYLSLKSYLGCCAWWLGDVGRGLDGGSATWLPRGKRGGVSLDKDAEGRGGGATGVEMGVAAIEGVAAIDEVGVAAPGAVTGVDTGANEPLLLVSLKPRVTALKKIITV